MTPDNPQPSAAAGRHRDLIDAAWRQAQVLRGSHHDTRPAAPRIAGQRFEPPGYEIQGEIHRGGQGVVYRAIQESTRRTVAIKVLHGGPLAGAGERARFEREVQVLAQLKHPNIVTIHDSGSVGDTAFFVMDYIDGPTLDRFVLMRELPTRDRLLLVQRICEAIHAAHLRGVIHRDLKPSNIRVDDEGEPHVLDFGLAKAEHVELGGADGHTPTMTGQFVGSLPWASPEQAEGRLDELDVRSDVYSLGVMLFQLLTDQMPYATTGRPLREAINNICNAEPPALRRIRPELDDEISAIVLKALRKPRESRYQSAGALALDIERYLAGEPIEARGDSLSYMLRKSLRRHRVSVGVATAFIVMLVAGLVTFATLWRQAALASNAERQQALRARSQAERAENEAAKASAINEFLRDLLIAADPTSKRGPNVTMRETLDAASARVSDGTLANEPTIEAAIHATLGLSYYHLGVHDAARTHMERALELRRKHLGPAHRDIADDLSNLAMLTRSEGNLGDAEALYHESLAMYDTIGDIHSRQLGDALTGLGLLLVDKGKFDEAATHFEHCIELERAQPDLKRPSLATALNNYAILLRDRGDFDKAESLFKEAVGLLEAHFGDQHMRVADARENLASVWVVRGNFEAALPLYEAGLQTRRRLLGPDHPDVASSLNNLGYLNFRLGRFAQSEACYAESLELRRRILPSDHPDIAVVLNNLGLLYATQDDHARAEVLYREALAIKRARLGDANPSTLLQMANLASSLRKVDRVDEALAIASEALALAEKSLSPKHLQIAYLHGEVGANLMLLGCFDESETELLTCYRTVLARFGPRHDRTQGVMEMLALLYHLWNKPALLDDWEAARITP